MMPEATPVAVITRRDTAEDRVEAANLLRNVGCKFVRWESRADGVVAALGFTTETHNVTPL